jgi:hypothetical protein
MTRCIAFLLALVFASLSVSSACLAADLRPIRLTLESGRGGGIGRPASIEAFGLMALDARRVLVDVVAATAGVAK